jgi:hypothetical protein
MRTPAVDQPAFAIQPELRVGTALCESWPGKYETVCQENYQFERLYCFT